MIAAIKESLENAKSTGSWILGEFSDCSICYYLFSEGLGVFQYYK